MRPAGAALMGGLNEFLGGQALVPGSRGPAATGEACDLGHLESGRTMQQEVREKAARIVVVALVLSKTKNSVPQGAHVGGQARAGDVGAGQPVVKGERGRSQERRSRSRVPGDHRLSSIMRRVASWTENPQKIVWC